MMKNNWKKALVIAGAITALSASVVFAANQTEFSTDNFRHMMSNGNFRYGSMRMHHNDDNMHFGSSLTEEQIQERRDMRDKWRDMTPEERQAVRDKWHQQRLDNMTPEQKARYEERQVEREKWRNMSPEERRAERERMHDEWDSDSERDAARANFGGRHCDE